MILPDFDKVSVLVAGDIMLDRYWSGSTERISPEAPVPVVKQQQTEDRLGGAANVALNLSVYGINTALSGLLGKDETGRAVGKLLTQYAIDNYCLESKQLKTITKLRVMSRNQQLLRVDTEEPINQDIQAQLLDHTQQYIHQQQVVVLSDYDKGSYPKPQQLIHAAKKANTPILIDPKGDDYSKYKGATLLTPNRSELEQVVGPWHSDEELYSKVEQLRQTLDLQAMVVTLSEKGMLVIEANKSPVHFAASAREVFDVTGAGDTVIATLAACIACGVPIAKAAYIANQAAAVVVGKLGTASVTLQELQGALQDTHEHKQSVVNQAQLLDYVSQAKAACETIVMTNGCFDLLHPGHLAYLQEAAALGDRLIVAVNSDDSVKRLKGQQRPINTLMDRMQMLAAIKGIDWVVDFNEDTPQQLIAKVLPTILVKGGDYQPEQIAGYTEVKAAGGHVKILKFLDGYSSTQLINRIKQA